MPRMTIAQWMAEHAHEYDDHVSLARACMAALEVQKSGKIYATAKEALGSPAQEEHAPKTAKQSSKLRRRTFEQLQQSHDLAYQIPKAIDEIASEFLVDGGWLMDSEMLTEVCVRVPRARSRWPQYRDREEYAKFQAHTPGDNKLIWIDPKYRERAERMRAN